MPIELRKCFSTLVFPFYSDEIMIESERAMPATRQDYNTARRETRKTRRQREESARHRLSTDNRPLASLFSLSLSRFIPEYPSSRSLSPVCVLVARHGKSIRTQTEVNEA